MAFKVNASFVESFEKEVKETKVSKDIKDTKDIKGVKDTKDVKGTKVSKGAKGVEVHKDVKYVSTTPPSTKKSTTKKTATTTDYKPDVVKEMLIKDNGKGYKEWLEASVKRFGDDGIPYVHLSSRVESEVYSGYKKGKHISFPLEFLYDFLDMMNEVDAECDKKHVE